MGSTDAWVGSSIFRDIRMPGDFAMIDLDGDGDLDWVGISMTLGQAFIVEQVEPARRSGRDDLDARRLRPIGDQADRHAGERGARDGHARSRCWRSIDNVDNDGDGELDVDQILSAGRDLVLAVDDVGLAGDYHVVAALYVEGGGEFQPVPGRRLPGRQRAAHLRQRPGRDRARAQSSTRSECDEGEPTEEDDMRRASKCSRMGVLLVSAAVLAVACGSDEAVTPGAVAPAGTEPAATAAPETAEETMEKVGVLFVGHGEPPSYADGDVAITFADGGALGPFAASLGVPIAAQSTEWAAAYDEIATAMTYIFGDLNGNEVLHEMTISPAGDVPPFFTWEAFRPNSSRSTPRSAITALTAS